jgi:hypothetical protein
MAKALVPAGLTGCNITLCEGLRKPKAVGGSVSSKTSEQFFLSQREGLWSCINNVSSEAGHISTSNSIIFFTETKIAPELLLCMTRSVEICKFSTPLELTGGRAMEVPQELKFSRFSTPLELTGFWDGPFDGLRVRRDCTGYTQYIFRNFIVELKILCL